jgi:microcystin-dependent protein
MATGVQSWSKTASSNATADANVNWAEGMAPSAVNNSARAEMASVAMWRDDLNGTIDTGGSSTAYTVTSNQTFGALAAGLVIAFVPHTTSGVTPTLSVDGLTAKPIRAVAGADMPAGVWSQGTPYVVSYSTDNSGEWLLFGINEYSSVPIGAGMDYWGATAPASNFIFAYGQAISRTTYATLFARLGTTHGVGNGSTTFNVPDKRGRVTAGKCDMGGSSTGRLTATYFGADGETLGAVGGSESHTLTEAQMPAHDHDYTDAGHLHPMSAVLASSTVQGGTGGVGGQAVSSTNTGLIGVGITILSAGSGTAHNNVQPTIIANYIIRAL